MPKKEKGNYSYFLNNSLKLSFIIVQGRRQGKSLEGVNEVPSGVQGAGPPGGGPGAEPLGGDQGQSPLKLTPFYC